MNILALDTCTEMCSAALLFKGETYEISELTQRGHSEKILGMMERLMADTACTFQHIDAIAFGRGPGSFTGVRVSVGVAQGIAYARDLPVAPVSSLAAVAQGVMDSHDCNNVAVAMDARMGEVYSGYFQRHNQLAVAYGDERVCGPDLLLAEADIDWYGAGTGWREYQAELRASFGERLIGVDAECFPQASAIAKLAYRMSEQGQLLSAEQAEPVYLRNNVAKKKGEQ